jgi:hypothetical protein
MSISEHGKCNLINQQNQRTNNYKNKQITIKKQTKEKIKLYEQSIHHYQLR